MGKVKQLVLDILESQDLLDPEDDVVYTSSENTPPTNGNFNVSEEN